MAARNRPLLALLFVACALLVGAGVFLFALGGDPVQVPPSAPGPAGRDALAVAPAPEPSPEVRAVQGADEDAIVPGLDTTVVWPVKVELELVRAAHLPTREGTPPLGSGAAAALTGLMTAAEGVGYPGRVTFDAGPNVGRELFANEEGRFGASDLYPGLSVVVLHGPAGRIARRETLLRRGATSEESIAWFLSGAVRGRVFDRAGDPLPGVAVEIDGHETETDENGDYYLGGLPSGHFGHVLLSLSKPGFATRCERIGVPVKSEQKLDHLNDRPLVPAARLTIVLQGAVGGPDDALIYVLPDARAVRDRSYPWYRRSPIRATPGRPVTIDDLPPGVKVDIRVFRPGAVASPELDTLVLREGDNDPRVIRLESAPSLAGRVLDPEGAPVPDAPVRFEAPDRVGATLTHFRELPDFLEGDVLPILPIALQTTRTDRDGTFRFSLYPQTARARYLVAEDRDGTLFGARIVDQGTESVDLHLHPIERGRETLSLRFPKRWQALPVEVWIQGAPQGEQLVPALTDLELPGLAEGEWTVRATWSGTLLTAGRDGRESVTLAGPTRHEIALPAGAIEGQDEETRRRSGRFDELGKRILPNR